MKKVVLIISILFLLACNTNSQKKGDSANDEFRNEELSIDVRVEKLLSQMTIEEKVGQMLQAERGSIQKGEVKKYYLGSILSGGGSAPVVNDVESWRNMISKFQKEALSTRLGIPILYGIDAVHGNNNIIGATIFPHNIGLGATRDPELIRKIGEITAKEMTEIGAKLNFAPCVAVAKDPRWGRTYESFGETPELQELFVRDYIKGFQGDREDKYLEDDKVVATAKHYVADGAVKWGTGGAGYPIDRGDAIISEEELRETHLVGYKEAIKENVGAIMISFSSWNGKKMHEHSYLINDVLKNELKFNGFVISDWQGITEISGRNYYEKVVNAVNAGIDMFMEPYNWRNTYKNILKAVKKGDVSEDRINDSVSRILRVKFHSGIFENPLPAESKEYLTGNEKHREIAREAVRKSLVLLKNKNDLLPLNKDMNIFVGGSCSDNMGYQSGGWTKTWQGGSDRGKNRYIPGTTILKGIRKELEEGVGEVITDVDEIEEADAAIIVIGERPYAEGKGDTADLRIFRGLTSKLDKQIINTVNEKNIPTIVVIVSGRPLIISEEIDNWDSVVAAWLPGSEGNGVSDVLFGKYNFQGKLPISWSSNIEEENNEVMFPYGYGLNYNE